MFTANKKGEKPFKTSYGNIGHLRGFTRLPFLCLTATASSQVRKKIIKSLNTKDTKVIRHSPDKNNRYYSVEKCSDIEETFQPTIKVLNENTVDIPKTIMLKSFMEEDGKCRVLIATSALGVGVNIQDVRKIIHYGVPHDLESYVQEVGRGGRDGKPCEAMLYYRPFYLAHCYEHMCSFVKNTENVGEKS